MDYEFGPTNRILVIPNQSQLVVYPDLEQVWGFNSRIISIDIIFLLIFGKFWGKRKGLAIIGKALNFVGEPFPLLNIENIYARSVKIFV